MVIFHFFLAPRRSSTHGHRGRRAEPNAGPRTPRVCPHRITRNTGRAQCVHTADPCNKVAQSWNKPRHVVAKVEWRPGELYPHVGFIVTNLARSAEGIVAFYNRRGTCEQWIKEGKGAIKWP